MAIVSKSIFKISYRSKEWNLTWPSARRSYCYLKIYFRTIVAKNIWQLTLHDNDTVGGIRSKFVGRDTFIFSAVRGLTVDNLDGNDTVSVSNGIQGCIQWLAGLKCDNALDSIMLPCHGSNVGLTLVHWMAG